jgi:antitoxin ParD1/3/4
MKPEGAMTMVLPPELERYVRTEVERGEYASDNEVVVAALQAWRERREAWFKSVDEGIARGLADIEAGRVHPAEEVFDELRAKYSAMAAKQKPGAKPRS